MASPGIRAAQALAEAQRRRVMDLREAVREAAAVAAKQGDTRLPAQPQMPLAQRVGIGSRASAAVGPDAPAPRPAPLAGGGPLPAATREQLDALRGKRDKFQQDVQAGLTGDQLDPLTVEEGLLLARAGDDPMQTFGRALSDQEIATLMRRMSEGAPVTTDEVLALQRSLPGRVGVTEPDVPQRVTAVVMEDGIPQMIGDDGQRLGAATVIPAGKTRPARYEFDGRAYQVDETGEGLVDVGPAAGEKTPEQIDAELAASNIDLAPTPLDNLRRNRAAADPPADLAQMVTQYTTNAPLESLDVSAVRKLWDRISKQYPAGTPERGDLEAAFSTWRRDPSAPDAPVPDYAMRGIEDGRRRLATLEAMATDPSFTQPRVAAETLDRARSASQPPRPSPVRQPIVPQAAGLPAAIEQFNSLPPALRESAANRLASNPNSQALDATSLLDSGPDGLSISPNTAAALMRPQGEVGELLEDLDAAMRTGDTAAADAARELIQGADPEARSAAIKQWQRRLALDTALREVMQEIEPAPAVAMSPGQPPLRPQGALTPDPQTIEVPEGQLPGQFEEAGVGYAESLARQRDQPSLQYRVSRERRLEAAGLDPKNPRNPAFYGADRPELRSYGDRLIDSNDKARINAVRDMPLALASLEEAQKAADSAKGVKKLAAAVKRLDAAKEKVAELEKLLPRGRMVREKNSVPLKGDDHPAKGVRIRFDAAAPAWTDSRMNRAGSARTRDDLLATVLGRRPKPGESLSRSSDSLSPADVNAVRDSALDEFGDDAAEVLPDMREDSLDPADLERGGPRARRVRGRPQPSRVMGGLRGWFGDTNPLRLANNKGELLYATADEVAGDMLAGAAGYRPGTLDYDLARQELSGILREHYGQRTNPLDEIDARTAEPVTGTPAGDARPGTSRDVSRVPQESQSEWPSPNLRRLDPAGPLGWRPNAAGTRDMKLSDFRKPLGPEFDDVDGVENPIDLTGTEATLDDSLFPVELDDPFAGDPNAKPVPKSKVGKGGKRGKATAEDEKLDASATTINDAAPPSKAVEGADSMGDTAPLPGALTDDEIKAAAQKEYDDAIRDGFSKKVAKERKQQYIKEAQATRKGTIEVRPAAPAKARVTAPTPAPAGTKTPRPLTQAELDDVAAGGRAVYADAITEGLDEDAARQSADQWMEEERAVRSSQAAEVSDADTATKPSPAVNDVDATGRDGDDLGVDGADDVAAAGDPVAAPPAPPVDGAASPQQTNQWPNMKGKGADSSAARTATTKPKTWLGRLSQAAKWGAAGTGVVGVINGVSLVTAPPDMLDIPVPAGGIPAAGNGLPPGFVPGPAVAPAAATEARLQAIVDRLESSRRGGASSGPTYGTYQNINFWR